MKILVKLLINAIGVFLTAQLIAGVQIATFTTAIIAAFVFGLINTFIKPLILIFTFPINLLTLGLFKIVINAGLVLLAAYFVEGFFVDGFLSALMFVIIFSLISTAISLVTRD